MATASDRELLRSLLVLDPDELVDILGIESKDLLAKFPEKVREYINECNYDRDTYRTRRVHDDGDDWDGDDDAGGNL